MVTTGHCFEKRRHNGKEVVHGKGEISTENEGFSTDLCHLRVMYSWRKLTCLGVKTLSDLQQVAEHCGVGVDISRYLPIPV